MASPIAFIDRFRQELHTADDEELDLIVPPLEVLLP